MKARELIKVLDEMTQGPTNKVVVGEIRKILLAKAIEELFIETKKEE